MEAPYVDIQRPSGCSRLRTFFHLIPRRSEAALTVQFLVARHRERRDLETQLSVTSIRVATDASTSVLGPQIRYPDYLLYAGPETRAVADAHSAMGGFVVHLHRPQHDIIRPKCRRTVAGPAPHAADAQAFSKKALTRSSSLIATLKRR